MLEFCCVLFSVNRLRMCFLVSYSSYFMDSHGIVTETALLASCVLATSAVTFFCPFPNKTLLFTAHTISVSVATAFVALHI